MDVRDCLKRSRCHWLSHRTGSQPDNLLIKPSGPTTKPAVQHHVPKEYSQAGYKSAMYTPFPVCLQHSNLHALDMADRMQEQTLAGYPLGTHKLLHAPWEIPPGCVLPIFGCNNLFLYKLSSLHPPHTAQGSLPEERHAQPRCVHCPACLHPCPAAQHAAQCN
eukprot:1158084-Pelagomonas_calceolata.AAC.10